MKLTHVEIKNFRSIESIGIDLSDGMNVLVGMNNAGKSNVIRALQMALDPEAPFSSARDVPTQRLFAFPRTTLTLRKTSNSSRENTLFRYLAEYELSLGVRQTYAENDEARLVVTYRGNRHSGMTRQQYFAVKGSGDRRGDTALNERALGQFNSVVRFVSLRTGQNLEELLTGKFREILHSTLRESLQVQLAAAETARESYIDSLQTALLSGLRDQVQDIAGRLFPEIRSIGLSPEVTSIEQSLSQVSIHLTDAADTELGDKGSGVTGGVLVGLLRYLADTSRQSLVIALEEPEAFLHPAAQEELRDQLELLAEQPSVSLLMTTHSPFVISRSAEAQVIAIEKDSDGISTVTGRAVGNQSHASLIGGLFRDDSVPELLDRQIEIKPTARALLVVEGLTDASFLTTAADVLGQMGTLDQIQLLPQVGAFSAVLEAILRRAEQDKPVWILLDSDAEGRSARDSLVGRFKFARADVLEYGKFVRNGFLDDTEAEWLFPAKLLQEFVDELGEGVVLKSKQLIAGEYRFDFLPVGKDLIPDWIADHADASDMAKWGAVLAALNEKLNAI
jgi:putative ATP-dependent endonuclease of OLD family